MVTCKNTSGQEWTENPEHRALSNELRREKKEAKSERKGRRDTGQ